MLWAFAAFSQSIPADTTNYLASKSLDSYTGWSFSRQTGTSGSVANFNGLHGDGLKLDFNFPASGGWVNLEVPVGTSFSVSNPFVFFIYSTTAVGKLEIKFIDRDGSVFWIKPALSNYAGRWTHVCAYLENAGYAWGGDSKFDTPAKFSIAISNDAAGSGTIYLDETGVGKLNLPSSFLPTLDPNYNLPGIGFDQRRDTTLTPEDPLVLAYLGNLQDFSSNRKQLVPTYWKGLQAQTFNNCLTALAFISKNEKQRAERILDFYQSATDSLNTDSLNQNFFYRGEARGFFQECDINTLKATGAKNRWIGDMAWLLITCKNYQNKYSSSRYEYLIGLIKDLFISFYKAEPVGGYIQHGWEFGDTKLHENYGHHEGNIDCYVALKLCEENFYAGQIKKWLDDQLNGNTSLPLDLYTWRTLAFGAFGESYVSLLNIPEYDFRYRKIAELNGRKTMGMYSNPDITVTNFWNDGTGHISCAFQAFGEKQRGYFYANQMDLLIVAQNHDGVLVHGIPYTLNTQGYPGVDPQVAVVSSSAWYILAKNGINPFLSEDFASTTNLSVQRSYPEIQVSVFPNPFSDQVFITIKSPENSKSHISIYSPEGQNITAYNFNQFTDNVLIWNGKDRLGNPVKNGLYLIGIQTGDIRKTIRILKIK